MQMEAGVAVKLVFPGFSLWFRSAAAVPCSWDLWHCLLFSQVNAPNPERRVLINHKYLFILAEGSKVICVHSCLKQIIEHQEGNRLAIKRIKCICSCLIVWMQSLNVLICQVSWHRWDYISFFCSPQLQVLPL